MCKRRELTAIAVLVASAIAACVAPPQIQTSVDLSATHAQATARSGDDMTFNVPPHSLERCTRVPTRLSAASDPEPDLVSAIASDSLLRGCIADGQTPELARRILGVVGVHVDIDGSGRTINARILDRVGEIDPALESCLLGNARSTVWPANRHGRPYEKHIFNVFVFAELGHTQWRMIDAIRRLAEPRHAMCACLRDASPDVPQEFGATFELPTSHEDTGPTRLVVHDTGALGQCVAAWLSAERFASRGRAVDMTYVFHVDPADETLLEALARGEVMLPTAADEAIVAIWAAKP